MDSHKTSSSDETNSSTITMAESGSLPDFLFRYGVCKSLHDLSNSRLASGGNLHFTPEDFISNFMRPFDDITPHSSATNEQRSELPVDFFQLFLGDYLKYSCCYWPELEWHPVDPNPSTSLLKDVVLGTSGMTREFENKSTRQLLTQAEVNMIRVTLARAEVRERQCVLDLGCGWGSAAIYILENNTHTKVVAVTNSSAQTDFIKKKAQEKKVSDRLLVITCNVANFEGSTYRKQVTAFMGKAKFDRIYSIETFGQVRNWERLLTQLKDDWLEENGKILVDVFTHKSSSYPFDSSTFLGKHFFVGRIMPAHDLIKKLDKVIGPTLEIEAEYKVNGRHYSKTCEAWLKLLYQEKGRITRFMEQAYGKDQAKLWFNRWRIFFLTMAEATRMREGTEWCVSQYLLRTPKPKEEEVKENK